MSDVVQSTPKGIARIYACGGTSINIMGLIDGIQINPDLLAKFEIVLIDTSNSNITSRSSNVESYMLNLGGVDGGGKDRAENEALIREHTKPILKKHPPGDINIVLSTGSGSSGSVAATSLTNELLQRGECVVVLLIGTTGSRREALNSVETLKNYEQIAKARQSPVIMHYLQNSAQMPRSEVNSQMISTISYLSILFSRRNTGMDTKDLVNWLYFTRPEVTKGGLTPQLYSLVVLLRELGQQGQAQFLKDIDGLGNILSVATLAKPGNPTELPEDIMPEYHTEGFVAEIKDSKTFTEKSADFLIVDGLVASHVESLRSFAKRAKPDVAASSLLEDDDEGSGVSF